MSQNTEAIIEFPIKLVAGDVDSSETSAAPSKSSVSPTDMENLKDFIENTDQEGLNRLLAYSKNPSGAIQGELLGLLGRAGIYGAVATAIISLVAGAPEVIMAVVNALAVKGGPLNQDYHRFYGEETQLGISRDLQYRRAVGLDVVITSEDRGYLLSDPGFVNNSLVDVDLTRSIRVSTNETQYGYQSGM